MKKILYAVPVAAFVMLASCGQQKDSGSVTTSEKSSSTAESAASVVNNIENCTDPDSLKAFVEAAQAHAARLDAEGKIDSARAYLSAVIPAVVKKDPSLADRFNAIKEKVAETYDSVAGRTGTVVDSIKSKGSAVYESTKEAVGDAAGEVKDKAGEVAGNVGEAVNGAVDKAGEVAREGVDKVKGFLHKK